MFNSITKYPFIKKYLKTSIISKIYNGKDHKKHYSKFTHNYHIDIVTLNATESDIFYINSSFSYIF